MPTTTVVNWVLKDGLGYLSKILLSKFSWHFYANPKGWRLFVDLLENTACGLEILTLNFASSHEQITQYLSNLQCYFHVNSQHVRNKLKVIMFPFLHQGHWTRITEPVGGMLLYKPPIQDINAQDLYIPLMAFGTYVVIASYALGVLGRSLYIQNNFVCSVLRVGRVTPKSLTQFTKGLLGWFLRVILIRVLLYSLESGEASLLDVVAYAGYRFAGTSLTMLLRIFWGFSYYFVLPWFYICTGVFLVTTMNKVLLAHQGLRKTS